MTIEKTVQDKTVELKLVGWLNTQTAPLLEEELRQLPEDAQVLVLDCAQLEYVSSAGLRQIVVAFKRMNGHLRLRAVSEEIAHVLKMTGLQNRLQIEA